MPESVAPRKKTKFRYAGIQTKFLVGLATIFIFFSALATITVYFFEKKSIEAEAYSKSQLVMTAMEASRSYVREILRPKMYQTLADDDFIIEAMSSSYISREIMERFNKQFYDFSYRRVAINSRNPRYEADNLEQEMIAYFKDNPDIKEWDGIISRDNQKYFMRFQPVRFDESCLHCHGNPDEAPREVVALYGKSRGFHRQPRAVAGVISVGLPVDISLQKIKEIAITTFIGIIPPVLFLFTIISVFFNRIIAQNLQNLLNKFKTSIKDEQGMLLLEKSQKMDEISELTDVAETMADHLRENRIRLEQYAEEVLRAKDLLQSVFDGISDPVVLLGENGTIKTVNSAFLHKSQLSMDEVIHRTVEELPQTGCTPLMQCGHILSNMPEKPTNLQVQMEQGEIFLIHFYPILNDHERPQSIVCYIKDITEDKKLELKIQHTEKIVSLGQLAAGVAHEINNPLGVILCHVDLIKDDPSLTEESLNDLATIERHAQTCRTIIADMLNFARQHKTTKEQTQIHDIIEDVSAMVTTQFKQQKIALEVRLGHNIPLLCLDRDKIKQVILNILINSFHAIGKDGHILITTHYSPPAEEVHIAIEDDGPGVAPDIADKIFDPFFTTKSPGKGTGLGLSVSYGIIQDHSGDILLESSPGTTRFIITLPEHENSHEDRSSSHR